MKPRIIKDHLVFPIQQEKKIRACFPVVKEGGGFFALPFNPITSRILKGFGIDAPALLPRIVGRHIVFTSDNPAQIRTCFPDLKEGSGYFAVPLTLESARVLRNLGIEAPSPIESDYTWPIIAGRQPRWYQIATSSYLTLNPRAHVHNAPRTGKTLSVLWSIDYLQKTGVIHKALVVAPLSTLERAWGDEIFLNFPGKRFAVLHGSAEKRRKLLASDQDIYVINHDGVEILQDELAKRGDIDMAVIDEVAVMRNAQTSRWKSLNKLVNGRGVFTWCWGLTGTPTSNEPTDAYGQAKLVRPETVKGLSFTRFKDQVMQQFGMYRWVPRPGAEANVARVLSPSIRFERTVVTSMEPCLIERHAELSSDQKHHINKLLKEAATEIDGAMVSAANAAVLLSKIVQCALGAVLDVNGDLVRMDFGPRMKVLEEAIEENGAGKVIVFLPFTGPLNIVAAELRKKWSVEVVDGSVSAGKRNQIFADFQNKKDPHVMVAHPKCMAHGLELTAADLSIWYGPYTSNEVYTQACCRIDGGGQKSKMDVMHISATATERKIYAVVREKGRLQDACLEALKEFKK
jgi:Uri superfamily endonuclease